MTQHDALAILKMGNNVFLTGGAGSGKTFVLNAYIKYLKEHGVDVAITASTGIAATHMGGMTIHAWSGIGIRDYISDYDIDQMEEKKYLWDRYDQVKVLIIDEISMLSGSFLDNLDRICRSFKRNPDIAFGGIQIVLAGDLFQLPPISDRPDFVVDSNIWNTMNLVTCYITEQHRQDDDAFTTILNAIRENNISNDHYEILESRIKEFDDDEFASMTKLFTHNSDVDTINNRALFQIAEKEYLFEMTAKGKSNLIESLMKSCLAPQKLVLKIGAEVMFVKNNFDKGYVNGTRGIVVDFDDMDQPIVETRDGTKINVIPESWSIEDDGRILASITQLPLRHAWAITVHKSQGMSLDEAVIDLSRAFAYGMGYVALSRVRRLDGLHLVGFTRESLTLDPRMYLVDQELQKKSARAAERLQTITIDDLQTRHDDFIIKSGGSLKVKNVQAKKIISTQKTHEVSYDMIKEGKTIQEVAKERDLVVGTIIDHLDKARQLGWEIDFKHVKPNKSDLKIIKDAFQETKDKTVNIHEAKLTPVKRYLDKAGEDFSFDEIKLVRLFLK